ncbi:MAG: type I restriction endonuclease subunit R [Prevotella sp.]|nr:type I restriction endonuclease subunit R [Prevotella sp.]
MDKYVHIADEGLKTVMGRYSAKPRTQTDYQSEDDLEVRLIEILQKQGYEFLEIHHEAELMENLRRQLEALNNVRLTDTEWQRLRDQICSPSLTMEEKTEMIQRDENNLLLLAMDSGENMNIKLIDRTNIHHNGKLQVIRQYEPDGGRHKTRFDLTILVNGLPLVHMELKKRGGSLREAFNQIDRYQRDAFWAGGALYDYAQIFVISNGTNTKYYSNTTRYAHEAELEKQRQAKNKTESNSFEFTSFWSDAENTIISDLEDFAETFLQRNTLLNILTRYCVYTVDKKLMIMRPYQIAATEAILRRINLALSNHNFLGTTKAGGYIWHTTGSGKTLTSFKTAQLASKDERLKKVLFVVDRKDLDYQTMKEYDNFEKDCANSNSSSIILKRQLKNPRVKIIITTIQKLSHLLKPASLEKDKDLKALMNDEVVLIFDECHRSQFGDMQKLIRGAFKKYMMFGFTGTPIFAANAVASGNPKLRTTAQVFGGEPDEKGNPTKPLHTYTIINAIRDHNVLKFKVDYSQTMKMRSDADTKMVWGIEKEEAWHNPKRIRVVAQYIVDHFAEKTKQTSIYGMSHLTNIDELVKNERIKNKSKWAEEKRTKKLQTRGFNSILAVDSVEMAIAYYKVLTELNDKLPEDKRLRIATIFTYSANEAEDGTGTLEDENPEGTGDMKDTDREELAKAIKDYNQLWTPNTDYSTDDDKFQSYYKDVSLRMKDKQLDILIVVGMFLTGFDAKTLNTLWVDKNLKLHGLLQAYSRTNRILNAVKDCGNIVCFRNLEKATEESLALFGDTDPKGIILMKSFAEYYLGFDERQKNGMMKHEKGYVEIVEELTSTFPLDGFTLPESEKAQADYIKKVSAVLRMQNLLSTFDEFTPDKFIINERDMQDYLGWYNTIYEDYKRNRDKGGKAESIIDDLEFEVELVKQVSVDIDYILRLVREYRDKNSEDKEVRAKILRAVDASPDLRDKRTLIEKFIDSQIPNGSDVGSEWSKYVAEERERELVSIIQEENLNEAATREFMAQAETNGYVTSDGLAITRVLPPMPLFGAGAGNRAKKKQTVLERLKAFFVKYSNI